MNDDVRNKFITVSVTTMMAFMMYGVLFVDRLIVMYVKSSGESVPFLTSKFVVALAAGTATLTLYCVREFDAEYPGVMVVHRFNRLHIYSDALMVVTGIMTGMLQNWLFAVYLFMVVFGMCYDIMLNIMLMCAPNYCKTKLDMVHVRVHMYTRKRYAKCIAYTMDEYAKEKVE